MLSNILTKFYLFFEGTENDNVTRVLTSSAVNNAVSQQFLADSVRFSQLLKGAFIESALWASQY